MTAQDAYEGIHAYFSQPDAQLARGSDGNCYYRSPLGRRCAVGCLIPDEIYEDSFETQSFVSLWVHNKEIRNLFPGDQSSRLFNFLVEAQNLHDGDIVRGVGREVTTAEEFISALDDLAHRYDLKVK